MNRYVTLRFMCWLSTEYKRLCLQYTDIDTLDDSIISIVDNSDILLSHTFDEAIKLTYERYMICKYFYSKHYVVTDPMIMETLLISDVDSNENKHKPSINLRNINNYLRKHLSVVEYNIYTMYLKGLSIKSIAMHEGLSDTTIRNIIRTINLKLKLHYGTALN